MVQAQPLVLTNEADDIAASPYASIYKKEASRLAIQRLISDSAGFETNLSVQEVNYGTKQPNGWCKFYIRNESDKEDWVFKIQQSRVDTVQLFIVRGGVIDPLPVTGHFQTLNDRAVRALPFAYNIHIEKGETVAFYLYTTREYGRHAAIGVLQTRSRFESYEYGFNLVLGFVLGMVMLAALVGFLLFLFVHQRLYMYYSIYAISFFFVLLADTGLGHALLFFPINQTVANGFTMIFYYWMGGCLGLFTIELLQLKQYAKAPVYWVGVIMSWTFCVFAFLLLIPVLPPIIRWAIISSSYYLAFATNLYILYILSISVLKKEPIVYFYMAGFYFTSIIALLLTLSDLQIMNFPIRNKDVYFLTPLVEILCVAIGIGFHFSRTVKERVRVQLELNQTQDQIITIQEDERRRIAQDLHDDVGNSLAAIRNMVIQKREATDVEKEINGLVKTVRTISHDLMPIDFNQFQLPEIVAHLVNKFKDHPNVGIDFDSSGESIKLKTTTELVIYRIINEVISNIFNHSKATKALIQLMYQKNSLVVTAEDNGVGMKADGATEGIGLRSIRLRAAYISATINFESDEKGTLIILEIPYEANR